MTKLTNNEAIEIRRAIEQGVTNRELAKLYGVSDTTISQIKGGTRHKNASFVSKQNYKLSDADIVEIQRALASGVRAADLARGYGVTPPVISQIKSGIRRPNGHGERVVDQNVEPNVWLTLTEAEALLNHLDACQFWITNHALESENEELAFMLQQRIYGVKK